VGWWCSRAPHLDVHLRAGVQGAGGLGEGRVQPVVVPLLVGVHRRRSDLGGLLAVEESVESRGVLDGDLDAVGAGHRTGRPPGLPRLPGTPPSSKGSVHVPSCGDAERQASWLAT
jgi:hypothetical protein